MSAAWAGPPIESVTPVSTLGFGSIAVLGGGSVTVYPQGGRDATGGVYLLGPDQGSPGQVLVRSNQPNLVFSVVLPDSFLVLQAAGGDTFRVSGLSSLPVLKSTGPGSSVVLSIGATLQFTRSPAPGAYLGSFPVTIVYP
jgi:hypothetical protein